MNSSSSPGIRNVLRALVRQLATAVYALVAFSLLARLVPQAGWAMTLVESAVVFAAAALLARLIEGPFWAVGLVGPFVALLDLTLLLLGHPESPMAALNWKLLLVAIPPLLFGLAGTLLVRRFRATRVPDAPSP